MQRSECLSLQMQMSCHFVFLFSIRTFLVSFSFPPVLACFLFFFPFSGPHGSNSRLWHPRTASRSDTSQPRPAGGCPSTSRSKCACGRQRAGGQYRAGNGPGAIASFPSHTAPETEHPAPHPSLPRRPDPPSTLRPQYRLAPTAAIDWIASSKGHIRHSTPTRPSCDGCPASN